MSFAILRIGTRFTLLVALFVSSFTVRRARSVKTIKGLTVTGPICRRIPFGTGVGIAIIMIRTTSRLLGDAMRTAHIFAPRDLTSRSAGSWAQGEPEPGRKKTFRPAPN